MVLNELQINNLRLKEIMREYDVTEQEFEYSGVEGVAGLLGWQIVNIMSYGNEWKGYASSRIGGSWMSALHRSCS